MILIPFPFWSPLLDALQVNSQVPQPFFSLPFFNIIGYFHHHFCSLLPLVTTNQIIQTAKRCLPLPEWLPQVPRGRSQSLWDASAWTFLWQRTIMELFNLRSLPSMVTPVLSIRKNDALNKTFVFLILFVLIVQKPYFFPNLISDIVK